MKLWGVLGLFLSAAAFAAPCTTPASSCRELVNFGAANLPLFSTHSITNPHPEITRAVIVVHGILRNADEYFTDVAEAARIEKVEQTTAVFAPHYLSDEDKPAPDLIHWADSTWKRGDDSLNGPNASSFAVLDVLVGLLADTQNFPNLRHIVLTGHSAGGQFMSRYVALSRAEEKLQGISVRYVPSNPSTWLYFNEFRLRPGSKSTFEVPAAGCPDYDEYPYGVQKPNAYAASVTVAEIENHLNTRNLTLLLGEEDKLSELLDASCGANLQGIHRYDRGMTYFEYLTTYLQPALLSAATVAKVGHSGHDMYQSSIGRFVLFR